jgi:uncharacterized membrane protein YhaH (DUF805 family)
MNLMFQPLRKYADFQGRARRSEYWLWYLFVVVVEVVLLGVAGAGHNPDGTPGPLGMVVMGLLGLFALAIVIPGLAVSFRRLHDTNRSAWWILIGLLPLIGPIVLLVFMVMDGTPGPNRFGPDPKGRGAVAEAFA